jgi:hypothetical protein
MSQFSDLYVNRLDEELRTDDSTRLFTTARRKHAINEGIRQFADLTEAFTKESSISCSNGVGEYDLLSTVNTTAADFVRLSQQLPEYRLKSSGSSGSTQYIGGQEFPRTTVQWLDQYEPGWRNSTGGTPQCWYERIQGGKRLIGMWPPPKITSSQTGTLRVPYVARPSSLTSDTDVAFKDSSLTTRNDLEPYHEAFAHYAAYRLEKLRVNTDASNAQFQTFMGYVQRFLSALRPKGGSQVKPARSYFGQARSRGGWGALRSWPTDKWGDR